MRKSNDIPEKLVVNWAPKSPILDSYRTIRTNVQFARKHKGIKTILITSPSQGEGKSITSANLAIVMAQNDIKTVYMDVDLRKPNGHNIFGVSNQKGVTSYLVEGCELNEIIQKAYTPNLSIVTSGFLTPNPTELLGSQRMDLFLREIKECFEIVILDSPSMFVPEASILAEIADGCILVIDAKKTKRNLASKVVQQLRQLNVNILGVVLNNMKNYYSERDLGKSERGE